MRGECLCSARSVFVLVLALALGLACHRCTDVYRARAKAEQAHARERERGSGMTYTSYTLSTVPIVACRINDCTVCSGTDLLLAQPCESQPEPNCRGLLRDQQCPVILSLTVHPIIKNAAMLARQGWIGQGHNEDMAHSVADSALEIHAEYYLSAPNEQRHNKCRDA